MEESRAMDEQALTLSTEHLGPLPPTTLHVKMGLACSYTLLDEFAKGVELARSGYEDTARALGTVHHETLDASKVLGTALLAAQRYAEVQEVLTKAVEMLEWYPCEAHDARRMAREKLAPCIRKGTAAQEAAERLEDSALQSLKQSIVDSHVENGRL